MTIIEKLYPINATLLGEGYDERLKIIDKEIPLKIIEVKSGTEFSTWTVPDEWIIRDAWIKYKGKKVLDYQKNPLSLAVYSAPFQGKMTKEQLLPHISYKDENSTATPHVFKFYKRDWGFAMPKVAREKLKEGEYEVFVDSEFKKGTMKIGVHTILGKSDKEVLLFAHLDHPFQANDNLSGVACLMEVAKKLKTEYTVKIIFCPETIGSIAYAHLMDLSKVQFSLAVDICGGDDSLLLLKAYDPEAQINKIAHCALQMAGKPYRKAPFRSTIGSDETVFNDPLIGIPSILLTTHSIKDNIYHTDQDTPDKINYEKISETADMVCKIIEIAEKNYVPKRQFKAPLMRAKYGIQSIVPQVNLNYDYLFYGIDGKKSLATLCADYELNFDKIHEIFEKIIQDGFISCIDIGKVR